MPCIKIMFHIKELHSHHANGNRITLDKMCVIKIINISINPIVKDCTSKIWEF